MGKPSAKKNTTKNKNSATVKSKSPNSNSNTKGLDKDMEIFISMSHELKEEGNKLFQKRDHEGAMLKYEKALNLLPSLSSTAKDDKNNNDVNVAYLRTNMAACYMQMGIGEYPRAIHQCDLALKACNGHVKALLKRAKCFHALDRFGDALKDVELVLGLQTNNLVALELAEILKQRETTAKTSSSKKKNKKTVVSSTVEEKTAVVEMEGENVSEVVEEEVADILKQGETIGKTSSKKKNKKTAVSDTLAEMEGEITSEVVAGDLDTSVKLVFGEDIRLAVLPANCSVMQLREVVQERFDCVGKTIVVKYKDQEGDFITITSDEELRWAKEESSGLGSVRLYVFEVKQDSGTQEQVQTEFLVDKHNGSSENGSLAHVAQKVPKEKESSSFVDEWIVQFARVFKTHVGFDSDEYLNLHELTMELHSHAMEETTTTEEAQPVLDVAANNFQEMAALAMFHWGNVHMARARKKPGFVTEGTVDDNATKESAKAAYEWAKKEYGKAGIRYEGSLSIKPDFYEAYLAMAQQQFEEAKLLWCYAIGCGVDLETCSTDVLQLFNSAEDSMEKGILVWEDVEKQRSCQLSKQEILSGEVGVEQSTYMRSHINLLWGIILYERSVVEFKLGIPVWNECLEVAVEKFQLGGVSATDVAVTIKNHCANQAAGEGLGFKVDEIVQAWNEMHDAKHWKIGVPSVRLEPLFRRRVPKLHHDLEYL